MNISPLKHNKTSKYLDWNLNFSFLTLKYVILEIKIYLNPSNLKMKINLWQSLNES